MRRAEVKRHETGDVAEDVRREADELMRREEGKVWV